MQCNFRLGTFQQKSLMKITGPWGFYTMKCEYSRSIVSKKVESYFPMELELV